MIVKLTADKVQTVLGIPTFSVAKFSLSSSLYDFCLLPA